MEPPTDAAAEPPGHVLWELVQTGHLATRRFTRVFAEFGITPAQFGVLASLFDQDDLSQAELARAILVRPQSLSRSVDELVRQGLVRRRSRGRGRRAGLELTASGREVVAAARPAAYRMLSPEHLGLDRDQQATLADLLQLVRQGLMQAEDGGP